MATKKNLISRQWYEKILAEINDVKEMQIPETLEVLKDARAQWDLSENSDYHAAKEKLSLLNKRIFDLESMIETVEIIDEENAVDSNVVKYGSIVEVDIENDKQYTIEFVGSGEVSVDDYLKLSLDSPIGIALDGKKKWDFGYIKVLNGKNKVTILSIK
jgi:transcription elongation factor GreA